MTEVQYDGMGAEMNSGNGRLPHVIEMPETISAAGLRQALRQVEHGRVILVVPRGVGAFKDLARSAVPLWQIVRRQADAQDLQVAVVTRDPRVRQLATDAGLAVFGSVESAQAHRWPSMGSRLGHMPPAPPRDRHRPASAQRSSRLAARFRLVRVMEGGPKPLPALAEVVLLAAVLVFCLVSVSGVLAFVVPWASVTLVPAQEPLTARVTVTARPDVEAMDAANLLIPARRIGQRVEGEGTIEATGTRSAPDAPAQGVVVFTNRQPTEQEIPAGTVVATSTGANVRFQTMEPATLPGGVGAQVTVPVEALEPGPAGNAPAFTINTVEGSLALSVNVINPQDMIGGSVKQVAVVTQADKDRLRARVLQQVMQQAYMALGELLEEGEFVPPETVGTLVIAETYDRFTDEEASQVSLRLRLLATALAVDGASGDALAMRALGANIPPRARLLSDSVTYTRGEAVVSDDDGTPVITFDVSASAVMVRDVDPAAVRASIHGLVAAEAVQTLRENWRLQTEPVLTLGPDWLMPLLRRLDFDWLPLSVVDRVPWLPFRIQVRVQFTQ